jgi:hypothetical protein
MICKRGDQYCQMVGCDCIEKASPEDVHNALVDAGIDPEELAKQTKRVVKLLRSNLDLSARNAALEAENAALKRWKAERTEVESQWNPQAVGKALGLQLGSQIREGILPGIQKLIAENAELRIALRNCLAITSRDVKNDAYQHLKVNITRFCKAVGVERSILRDKSADAQEEKTE